MSAPTTMSLRERLLDLADRIGQAGINGFGNELRDIALSTLPAEGDDTSDARRYRWLADAGNYPDWDWWANVLGETTTPDEFTAAINAAMIAATEGSTNV